MCGFERMITYQLDYKLAVSNKKIVPGLTAYERIYNVMLRTILYGLVTTLRLLYMLIIMYFNTGLFVTVVCILY